MDDEGFVSIVGRTKDMLIRGGENIYPTEIENFLFTHPKIESVQVNTYALHLLVQPRYPLCIMYRRCSACLTSVSVNRYALGSS